MSIGPVAEVFSTAEATYRRERVRAGFPRFPAHRRPWSRRPRPAATDTPPVRSGREAVR